MMNDGFSTCPHCGSNMCYIQNVGNEETWMCLSCGFTSTTLMKEGTESEKQVSAKHPSLYKDLKFTDQNGYVWYPAVITVPGKGMVYIDGSDSEQWTWVATPMRKLTFKEQRMKKFKGQKYIADSKKTKAFGKEGFMEACVSLDLFGNE